MYVTGFPGPRGKWQVSTGGGDYVRWSHDGKQLYYVSRDGQLVGVPVNSSATAFDVGNVQWLFRVSIGGVGYPYDVSPDDQRFLVNTLTRQTEPTPITVVLNWPRVRP